jgi:CopG family nickel-responsive transcriptional regulator
MRPAGTVRLLSNAKKHNRTEYRPPLPENPADCFRAQRLPPVCSIKVGPIYFNRYPLALKMRTGIHGMPGLSRTGVSLDEELLQEFDRLISQRGYQNRSEALRDLIRDSLLSEAVDSNKAVVGTLTLIYDHHLPNLSQKLTEAQHQAHDLVLAATHVHLDEHYCLEVIIMRGNSQEIRQISDHMLSMRGVKHGKLVLTGTGKELKKAKANHRPAGHQH